MEASAPTDRPPNVGGGMGRVQAKAGPIAVRNALGAYYTKIDLATTRFSTTSRSTS